MSVSNCDGTVKSKNFYKTIPKPTQSHSSPNFNLLHVIADQCKKQYENGNAKAFVQWLLWMIIGTTFYAEANFDRNYAYGFYYAVNVGYSIGWGLLGDYSTGCKIFSVFYILIGAIFATRTIVSLAENVMKGGDDLYQQYLVRRRLKLTTTLTGLWADYYIWFIMNWWNFLAVYIWLLYWFFGVWWSCFVLKWSFIDGLYFSISSMSTGGLYTFGDDQPNSTFICTGLYAAAGVPIMALAVANLANLFAEARKIEKVRRIARMDLTEDEAEVLGLLKVRSDQHVINKNEYLLLMLVKHNKLDPKEINRYFEGFDKLDVNQVGILSCETLFENNIIGRRKVKRDSFFTLEAMAKQLSESGLVNNILHEMSISPTKSSTAMKEAIAEHSPNEA
jgi:hypothetical protein